MTGARPHPRERPNGMPDPYATNHRIDEAGFVAPALTFAPVACGDQVVHLGKYAGLGDGLVVRVDHDYCVVRWQGSAVTESHDGTKHKETLLQWAVKVADLRHVASPGAWADKNLHEVPHVL